MNPPPAVYFRVPADGGRISFEKPTRLYTPAGKPFPDGAERSGWVELPAGQPGLWSFRSIDPGQVKVDKLPGFFAMGDPAFYLEHDLTSPDY
jgi:hypothetical protein